MDIRMDKNSIFYCRNMLVRNKNVNNSLLGNAAKENSATENRDIKNRLDSVRKENSASNNSPKSVVEQSIEYAKSLSASRMEKKSTTTQVKKLRYNFKKISSQILRSKTAVSARMAVSAAKRATQQLRQQLKQGKYDEDEAMLAIDHAKAMERVAKKKANHLEEEELLKAAGGVCIDSDYKDLEDLSGDEEEVYDETQKLTEDELPELEMTEMWEAMEASMKELLEETGLSQLDDMLSTENVDDPADFKMLQIKHRREEMKAIAKADAEYLKGMFDKYESNRTNVLQGAGMSTPTDNAGIDVSV